MTKQEYRNAQRAKALGLDGIEQCRTIVRESQYRKVNEVMVDLFSASAIVAVYDALNEENRTKFAALPVARAGAVAFKLIK